MARKQSPLAMHSQYLALRAASAGMHCFSARRNLRTARMIGSAVYHGFPKRSRRAAENLTRSFPDMPKHEVDRIAERSMQQLIEFFVETLFLTRMIRPNTWSGHVHFEGVEQAMDLILSDRPTILLTGHYGNFEVLGYLLSLLGIDMSAVARPIDNPLVNDWLFGVRQANGLQLITKWGATETMVDIMQRGGTIGFIADQNAGDKGMFVPFFDRLASAYKSIGLLAIRFNAPVICGYARRVGDDFCFDVGVQDIILPEQWRAQPDPLYYLTARYTRAIEQMVRADPEQYWWIHRRWKSRPRHERQGEPLPAAMRRKLQELPWMTDDSMLRLQQP